MVQRLPSLSWLRAFEAAARHLSFTHAAEELFLTQAAISKQVKLLEQFLREPLFERKPRSLVLTKVGAAYLPKVQDSFERLRAGTQEVFGNRRRELLTLRAPVGFSVNWIAPRLAHYLEQANGPPFRIVSTVWNDDFDKERFDLDIRYGTGTWAGFRADRLSWETVSPVCAPQLAARLAHPNDLATERLLHVMGYQDGWATWLAAAGGLQVDAGAGLHFDNSLMAFAVAAQGQGVALGRSSMLGAELAAGRLVQPFSKVITIDEAFYLLSPNSGDEHPDADPVRDWLVAEAKAAVRAEPAQI